MCLDQAKGDLNLHFVQELQKAEAFPLSCCCFGEIASEPAGTTQPPERGGTNFAALNRAKLMSFLELAPQAYPGKGPTFKTAVRRPPSFCVFLEPLANQQS